MANSTGGRIRHERDIVQKHIVWFHVVDVIRCVKRNDRRLIADRSAGVHR